jgi:RNA polymerase nonessential primary-like sigma factor
MKYSYLAKPLSECDHFEKRKVFDFLISGTELREILLTELPLEVVSQYLYRIDRSHALSVEEEAQYTALAKKGDLDARNKMIEHHLRLVISVAKGYRGQGVAFLDLLGEGNLGLIRAIEKFDPTRGLRFAAYSLWWVKKAMLRALAQQGNMIRMPSYLLDEINQFLEVKKHLEKYAEGKVRVEDLADFMGKTPKEILTLLSISQPLESLDTPLESNSLLCGMDLLRDEDQDQDLSIRIEKLESSLILHVWIDKLSDKHRMIISRRFGLEEEDPVTLEAIAMDLGVTRERIRQIQEEALFRLRRSLNAQGFNCGTLL